MKILSLLSIVLVASYRQSPNFDFLIGKWERANGEAGKQTFETWVKQNDCGYLALSSD